MDFVSKLSKLMVSVVGQPTLLFDSRKGLEFEKMSVLELICELEKRQWVKSEGTKQVRKVQPFNVISQSPTTWHTRKGFLPFKEYLLALLCGKDMKIDKVYHLQCKAYYQCLAVKPDVAPHQVAQFYKAILRRRSSKDKRPESDGGSAHLNSDDVVSLVAAMPPTASSQSAPRRIKQVKKQGGQER